MHGRDPQQYGIGFKEIWEIDVKNHEEGLDNAYCWLAFR